MNARDIITTLLNKIGVRVFLLIILTTLIGVMSNYIEKTFIFIGLLFVTILYIVLEIYYAHADDSRKQLHKEMQDKMNELVKQNELYLLIFSSFQNEFGKSAYAINNMTKIAIEQRVLRITEWSVNNEYQFVCDTLYSIIKNIGEKGGKYSISIISKIKSEGIDYYIMNARHSFNDAKPSMYLNGVKEEDAKNYYYARLFMENQQSPTVLMNSEEIRNAFYYQHNSVHKYEYSQYIGIPIACSGNHVIGLLQIIGHQGCVISNSKEVIDSIIDNIVYPFVQYGLLASKIERLLFAKAYQTEKKE